MKRIFIALLALVAFSTPSSEQFSWIQVQTIAPSNTSPVALKTVNFCGVANSVTPSQYYSNPGQFGTGQISTADCYGSDGVYELRAYDLLQMGTTGQALAAKYGRYYWAVSADHCPGNNSDWSDGCDFRSGFSADPQTPPTQMNNQVMPTSTVAPNVVTNPISTNPFSCYQVSFLAYAPEDTGNQFHWYCEGLDNSLTGAGQVFTGTLTNGSAVVTGISSTATLAAGGLNLGFNVTGTGIPPSTAISTIDSSSQITLTNSATANGSQTLTFKVPGGLEHQIGAFRTNDLSPGASWTSFGPVLPAYYFGSFTSFGRPTRISAGNWSMYSNTLYYAANRVTGNGGDSGLDGNGERSIAGFATGTTGLDFTRGQPPTAGIPPAWQVGTRQFFTFSYDPVTISSQVWIPAREDARHVLISSANPAVITKTAHGYTAGTTVQFEAVLNFYSGTVTSGQPTITGISPSTASIQAGMMINPPQQAGLLPNGTFTLPYNQFPPGATVQSVDSSSQITITANATANASNFTISALPIPILPDTSYCVLASGLTTDKFEISTSCGGAAVNTAASTTSCFNPSNQVLCMFIPNGGQYVSRAAMDANFNFLASPAPVRISSSYAGTDSAGPNYLQAVNSSLNCGVMTYYATRGFFASATNFGFNTGATYNSGNGALQQQLTDIYSEIVDPVAAASCHPMGVNVSVASGVATISWNDSLPTDTYRLYYGFSPNSQPNLVGDSTNVTSTTYTPNLQVPNVMYFKLVYLNGGSEKGSTIVSSYVSSSSAFVNKHITRALADGADPATIDRTFLDSAYNLLVNNNLFNSCAAWSNPRFGVVQDVNGIVTKTEDLCTTQIGRTNDLWFCTGNPCVTPSTTQYLATGVGNNVPGLKNNNTNSFGIFGGVLDANNHNGRLNPVRRASELTVFASYQRTSASGDVTLLATGEFGGVQLQHLGTGSVSMELSDDQTNQTATMPLTADTNPHVIFGTFGCRNGSGVIAPACLSTDTTTGTLTAYADGSSVGGTQNNLLRSNYGLSLFTTLKGQMGTPTNLSPWVVGTHNSKFNYGTPSKYIMENNEASFTFSDIGIFTQEMTPSQVSTFTTFLQNAVKPVVAQSYTITSPPFSALCDGMSDDSAAFASWNSTATMWDAANPNTPGVIQLTIPSGQTCLFLGSTGKFAKGFSVDSNGNSIHPLRVVSSGAGKATLSDNGTGNGFFLGTDISQAGDTTHSVRLTTALKGATSVTLNSLTNCASLWVVGNAVLITGLDMQGGGQPTNPAFWEYNHLSAVNCGTGLLTLSTPLVHDYKSTWPSYVTSPVDEGGPATIYSIDSSWQEINVEYNNINMSQTNNGSGCSNPAKGKSIVVKNGTITGNSSGCGGIVGDTCPQPSETQTLKFINDTMTNCNVELDKMVDTLVYQNISSINSLNLQSASLKQLFLSEVTTGGASGVNGSAINTYIAGSTLTQWAPGAHSFGASYGITYLLNNSVASFSPSGAQGQNARTIGTWAGGIYTIPNASIPSVSGGNPTLTWAIPGANIDWFLSGGSIYQYAGPIIQITDVTQDATNTFVHTSAAGNPTALLPGTDAAPHVHPAAQYFGVGNTGAALETVTLNPDTLYQGLPLGSYYQRPITSLNNNNIPFAFGKMTEVDFLVNPACSGASNFTVSAFIQSLASTTNGITWTSFANAAVANTTPRQMFPTSVAGSQSGDSLTSPSPGTNTWFVGGQLGGPFYNSVGNCGSPASTLYTIKANQGVVNPAQE